MTQRSYLDRVKGTDLDWRALAKRQWPLAVVLLAVIVFGEFTAYDSPRVWWQLPGSLTIAAVAVLAPRRPFDAAMAGAAALLASSVLLRWQHIAPAPQFFHSGAIVSETFAAAAIVTILVRQAPVWRAILGTAALIGGIAAAELLRSSYQFERWGVDEYPSSYFYGGSYVLAIAVSAGLYFRSRDRERARAVQQEITAAQHAERMALARELHDVVAHYVTAIVMHSQIAQEDKQTAHEVLPVITKSGYEALTAMRRLVGTLRGAEPTGAPSADLERDVRGLAEESGQPVRLSFDLSEQVPPELGRSVLRLVQESLTNSRKHGQGVSTVDVSVSTRDGHVHVLVQDNGSGQSAAPVGGSGGYGLVGMRERAELLGGTFHAGKREPRGWEVRASLPIA